MPKSKLSGVVRNKTGGIIRGVTCDISVYDISDHTFRLSTCKSDSSDGRWGCSVGKASGEKVLAMFSHKGKIATGDLNVAGAEFMETTQTITTSSTTSSSSSTSTTVCAGSSCKWNSLDKGSNIILSNGDMTASAISDFTHHSVRATEGKRTGKWYWEFYIDAAPSNGIGTVGMQDDDHSLNYITGGDTNDIGVGYMAYGTMMYQNGWFALGDSYETGDIIGVALDLDSGNIWFAKNNVWQGGGDPANGLNPAKHFTVSGLDDYHPAAGPYNSNHTITLCPDTPSQTYSPPSGFDSIC